MSSSSSSSTPSSIISSSSDDRKFIISETIKQAALFIKTRFELQLAGCSRPRKKCRHPPKKRDRYGAHDRLVAAYFSENPVYDEQVFRRRFRMSSRLFLRIVHDIESRSKYFQQTQDARGKLGFSALQKCNFQQTQSCNKWKRAEIPDLSGGSFKRSKTSETNSSSVPFELNLEFDDDFCDSQSSKASERKRKGKGTSTSSPNIEAALSRMEEGFATLMNHVYEFQKRDDARDKKKEDLIQTQKKLVEATEKQAKAYEDKQRNKDLDYYYTEFEGLRGKRLEHVQKRKMKIKEKYNLED